MPDLHLELRARSRRIDEPVHLACHDTSAEQLRTWADHDRARLGADLHDEHRLVEAARQAAPLTHREPRVAIVLAHDGAVASHERSARQRWCVRAQLTGDHLSVIAIWDEADV